MAINEVAKRQARARKMVQLTASVMDNLYELEAEVRRASAAGVVFVDADFSGVTGLEHLDAARITAAYTTATSMLTALRGANYDKVLEAIRG